MRAFEAVDRERGTEDVGVEVRPAGHFDGEVGLDDPVVAVAPAEAG